MFLNVIARHKVPWQSPERVPLGYNRDIEILGFRQNKRFPINACKQAILLRDVIVFVNNVIPSVLQIVFRLV